LSAVPFGSHYLFAYHANQVITIFEILQYVGGLISSHD
jgi:hypothetical protein